MATSRSGKHRPGEDDKRSLIMEIVSELADIALVGEYGIPPDDMTDGGAHFMSNTRTGLTTCTMK
jgi:hypothetical protein